MKPDGYYGAVAENYEASRSVKAKWQTEQAALAEFLTDGPVLDVPFGTGRFVPIYRDRGLDFTGIDISDDMLALARRNHGEVNASKGSAFDLRFADGAFATAVCVRFLEWLPLDRAKAVLDRLRRIAPQLIVTITHGIEGQPEAYTYDLGKFFGVIDGLLIERRCVTAHVRDMISEMFKLREACWSDVVEQFRDDYGGDAELHIQRIAAKHRGLIGLPAVAVHGDAVNVRAEYWSGERVAGIVDSLCPFHDSFASQEAPRMTRRPITVFVCDDGPALILDGRKRANRWMKEVGPHPVLVVRPRG